MTLMRGGIVVLGGDVGVFQAGHHAVVLVHAAGGQADGQADALLNDGALQEDIFAQLAFLTGDDGVGDLAHHAVGLLALHIGIGHPGDFGEYRPPDLDDGGIDASEAHSKLSFALQKPGLRAVPVPWVVAAPVCGERPSPGAASYNFILAHFAPLEKG